jgi:hypothetical protein
VEFVPTNFGDSNSHDDILKVGTRSTASDPSFPRSGTEWNPSLPMVVAAWGDFTWRRLYQYSSLAQSHIRRKKLRAAGFGMGREELFPL